MSNIKLTPFSELTETDIISFYEIRYSDYVHSNFGGEKPSLNSHLKWMKSAKDSLTYKGFAITLNNTVIGGCSLKSISKLNLNAEFDIFLSKSSSGKGYGRSALKKLLSYGFKNLKLNRIYAFLLESNQKAFELYSDIGFKKEGLLRENVYKNEMYLNSIIIGLLKKEYEDNY